MADRDQFNRGIVLPTLIRQLKSILQQYPDDGQILKELIQNAEDARARRVVFLLDSTCYSTQPDKLHHPDLAAYQGPALCVYNDAVFTSEDWKGITMLSESVKENDPMKVGRFGLGFKSVFHVTDLPSIFSGNGIGFLDPHEIFFKTDDRGYRTSAYLWDLKKNKGDIENLKDQFMPFHQTLFGVTQETFERGFYEGTMFRFPLRMEGMQSDLCATKYSPEKVRELFMSLETDAHIMLLFLKSLESIEVYEKTSITGTPTKILSINIKAGSTQTGIIDSSNKMIPKNVHDKRLQLIEAINTRLHGNVSDSISFTYALNVEFQRHSKLGSLLENPMQSKEQKEMETSEWVISHYYAGRSELEPVSEISSRLGVLPWVGVAFQVTDQSDSKSSSYLAKPSGHIFCFLPLPLEKESPTGLRVHVHGYFAVDSNRRHIKWPTADQNLDQLTDEALIWNEFLVNKLTGRALVNLALHLADPNNNLRYELVFNIIPDQVTPQWKHMADGFYQELPRLDIFYSQASGKWLNCRNSLFDNCEDRSSIQLLIRQILTQCKVDLVSAPLFLKKHFVHHVSPLVVCKLFKAIQTALTLSEEQKLLLLEYFLDNFPNGSELIGIKLLPLADGEWTEFRQFNQEKVYIESAEHPRSILPSLDRLFLKQNIPVLQKMTNLAQKNTTQLKSLDPQSVVTLLHSVFPEHWKSLNEVSLKSASHLSMQWLSELWKYLARYFPQNLQPFENFHILPVGKNQVTRLKCQAPIILSSHYGTQLEKDVKSVLIKLGLKVIDDLPAAVLGHQRVMGLYVFPPDATSVLSAMYRLFQQKNLSISLFDDADKKSLQSFLASGLAGKQSLVSNYKSLLMTLPIFKTVDGSAFKRSEYVPLSSVNQGAKPDMILPVNLPSLFIDLTENLVRDLAVNLGVAQKSTVEILEVCVFPAVNGGSYNSENIRKLMSFVCDNFVYFQSASPKTFGSSVSNVRFVPKQNGDLVMPREVFNNSDPTLCSLFTGDDVFPVGEFAKPKYVQMLRQLGTKDQNAVKAADLVSIAARLSISAKPDFSRAQTFLAFLESHPHLLAEMVVHLKNKCTLQTALLKLKWIEPVSCRPVNYPKSVKFVGEAQSGSLVLPCDVCSTQFSVVIGSVRPTIDVKKTPTVATYFGWTNRPTTDEVVHHLLNVVSSYSNKHISKFQIIMKAVYRFLNENIANSNHGTRLNELVDKTWIWTGGELAFANKVVMMTPFMDLKPHVYPLPVDLRDLSHLWNYFRIAESVDLVKILTEIHLLHTTSVCDKRQVDRDVQFAVAILNNISNNISNMPNSNEILSELLVPIKTKDENLCMKPIQDVTYCDKEWFQRGFDLYDLVDNDIYLVHPQLSPETAEALAIHGIIHRVLDAEELDVGFESYGQSEPLTTRLNSILKDYTDGMSVLKELIQNADDAGATEVKFLYDQRQNDDSKTLLFDKGMAGLQGPALWTFNNAIFTNQDFENLVKLSGATKEESKDKIGRFGLGFNAVYNLTDVPSLVSQNYVVLLDPHMKYLGRAIRDKCKPGIKLEIGKSQKKLLLLKDQFKPYNGIFDCDLGKEIAGNSNYTTWSYPGTLFRFPLRTAQQAETSKISNKFYSHHEVMALLELLNQSGHNLLLFTQNVRKIAVFHIPETATPDRIEEFFSIEKSLEKTIRSLNPKALFDKNNSELAQESSILKMASSILESASSDVNSVPPKIESSIIIKVVSQNSTQFAKLLTLSAGISESHWLVASFLGRESSFAMAKTVKDLTPVGGTAAKLRKAKKGYEPVRLDSSKSTSDDSAMTFCFLPLPVKSYFPVHINGSFALTSSRTHIYETTVKDKSDHRSQWNEALIKDAVTQAYLILLEDLLKVCHNCTNYVLWPVHESPKEAGCFFLLTESLYERIFSAGLTNMTEESRLKFCTGITDPAPKVIRENGRLLSMAECRYLEQNFRHETVGDTALTVLKNMNSLNCYVTDIPADVYSTVQKTCASKILDSKKIAKFEFFECFFLPRIEMVDAMQRDELTLYALFDQNLIELLRNVACIPVKPRLTLKKCSQLVHPSSFLAVLYETEDECFPEFRTRRRLTLADVNSKLVELGMREHDLPWEEIAERCGMVTRNDELVLRRLEAIIKVMRCKTFPVDEVNLTFLEQIKATPFLPAIEKPIGFPLHWKGDDTKFTSCNEGFLSSVKNLVCCVHPIISDRKIFGNEDVHLKAVLGLHEKQIPETDFLLQFQKVLELPDKSSGYLTGVSFDGVNHVSKICHELYKRFDELASKNKMSQRSVEMLSSMCSIFIDSSALFLQPRSCALNIGVSSESLLPYLGQIPRSIASFRNLLGKLQVRDHFQMQDFVNVLHKMHTEFEGMPLGKKELQIALCIVNSCQLSEISKYGKSNSGGTDFTTIYVPDKKGILFPTESLCYNNCPWVSTAGHHFCSEGITYKAASAIGMKSSRETIIKENSIGIPFGQREKLVNRLRRILSGYPFDKEVLKEMLQNADDANATEIHFINDGRQLPTERIFEDKWKPLQGPALCIFNNKPFTMQDLNGIQNLGEGSKSEDPTKTGQYGVGFNCVYHMTDAPTFLSELVNGEQARRILCAFDPTLKFVPGSTEANPGLLMQNISSLQEQFPDVFIGYFEEDYGHLGGTMFRLPLRNALTASQKDCIIKKEVTTKDVELLFETFKTDMYESLLFLNSVEKIQLKNSDADGNLETVYSVQVKMTSEAKHKRNQFNEKVKHLSKALKDNDEISLKDVGLIEVSYELVTVDSNGESDTWQIIQRFGFEDSNCIPASLVAAYCRGDIGLLPRCGVAHLKSTTRKGLSRRRRLFCFLPLPVQTDFPSHINGHFALDNETRRNLRTDEDGGHQTEWNECMMKNIIAPAYCSLIQEVRDSLSYKGAVTNSAISEYIYLFPSMNAEDGEYMKILSTAIYERIGKKNLPVLPVRWPAKENNNLWIGPHGMNEATWKMWKAMGWDGSFRINGVLGYFDNLHIEIAEPSFVLRPFFHFSKGKARYENVRTILVESGFLLINCPLSVSDNFTKAGIEVNIVSSEAVLSFFASYGQPSTLCRLESLPRPLKDTLFKNTETFYLLVEYVTQCKTYKSRLLGLPLLLTADGCLRRFEREYVKYEPFFSDLIPCIRDRFYDGKLFQVLQLDADSDTYLCGAFTVKEFENVLHLLLPPDIFKVKDVPVKIQTLKDILKVDNLNWLDRLWEFLFVCQKRFESNAKKTSNSLINTISPLLDWCVLPVSFRQGDYLFPMQKSRSVISLTGQTTLQRALTSCLQKIGIPQPLCRYFHLSGGIDDEKKSLRMYLQILGTLEDACSVVLALEEVMKFGAVEAKLSRFECNDLCHYLANFLDSWKKIPNSIDTVRQLPIFTTKYDRQVPLVNCCVYIIPSEIPNIDMESWTATRGIIFLTSNNKLSQLFTFLGCKFLTETEVYCTYIFKHFEILSPSGQLEHLRYVRELLNRLKETRDHHQNRNLERDTLVESLQELAFILTSDGSYSRSSAFYDNRNEVFRAMQQPHEFPPKPFDSQEWNDFLKKCGMTSDINQMMFLEYARQVEEKARVIINQELREQSRILVNHLFCRDDITDANFMNRVKNIRFLAPCEFGIGRERLHEGHGQKNNSNQNMFISFRNAITPENLDLVWTVQNILPCESVPNHPSQRQIIVANLEIQEQAKLETVVEHMKRLCTKWFPGVHQLKPHPELMTLVLRKCYSHLKSNLQVNSEPVLSTLRATPFIFDSKNCLLLRPEQIVVRMHRKKEISPYLITNPDELGEFGQLFQLLGSTEDDATLDQYCMVLEMVHDTAKDNVLDPNEREAVCKATRGLFKLLKKAKMPVTFERQLFLPATDETLQISSEILVDNNHGLRERMKQFDRPFLIDLMKDCGLKMRENELKRQIRKLPACHQPQFLTSVVGEEMEENFTQEQFDIVKMLNMKMQSAQMRECIKRIACHCDKYPEEEIEEHINNAIDEGLQRIRFTGVNTIRTYLVYKGKLIEGSETNREFFIKDEFADGKECCMIFVRNRMKKYTMRIFYHSVACKIQCFINIIHSNRSIVFLQDILECEESMMSEVLDMYGINKFRTSVSDECGIRKKPRLDSFKKTFRPRPGQFVPIHLHHLLKQDILLLKVGDFVALETDDPVDNVSAMTEKGVENLSSSQNDIIEGVSTLQPTYIIVKILEICNKEGGPNMVTYKVDDGSGERIVPAVLLYAFHRTATDARDIREILELDDADNCDAVTLDDAKSEIKQTLSDAWRLPDETMRTKYIRRLLHQWCPDKNSGNTQMATEATKYIFEVVDKLTKGPQSTNSYSGAFYSYIRERARKHQVDQQSFRQNYEKNTINVEERRTQYFINCFTNLLNPQPGEGQRWQRQADWDLKAVGNDRVGGNCPSGEWACFKCYQAAVKALKGARYARDSNYVFGDDLKELADVFKKTELSEWVLQLQKLLTGPSYMQYPNDHHQPNIPHEVFSDGIVQKAQQLSQKIVGWCRNYVA